MNIRVPSNDVNDYIDAVQSGDPERIRDIQRTFANLTPEERIIVQGTINEVVTTAEQPTKAALLSLRETMLIYAGMEETNSDRPAMEGISRNIVTPEGGRNISAWTPETGGVHPLLGRNLSQIEVSNETAFKLGEEVIGMPLSKEKIESYQESHRIGIDGKIGKETYLEMYAEVTLVEITESNIAENGISRETQTQCLRILRNATLTGTKTTALLLLLENFKNTHEDDVDFNERYQGFFAEIHTITRTFQESEEGQRVVRDAENTVGRDGRSLYAIATDESMPMSEKVHAIATDPMLLIGGAVMFLFGVFGSNTRFTDSFMKRLGIVLGGVFFGPAVWNKLGIGEAIEDLDNFTGATERFNRFFDRTSGSARERISEVRGIEGNELNRLFPDETLLASTLNHFESIERLNSLSLDSLRGYITALNSGETDSLPDFLKNITINGVTLSNTQIAIVLESMLATRRETDDTIGDLFEGISLPEGIGLGVGGLGLIGGLIYSFPPVATWTVIIGGITYVWGDEVVEYLGGVGFFNGLQGRIDVILQEIDDDLLRESIEIVLQNNEISFETKILRLQEIGSNNASINPQIEGLIDIVTGVYIESINVLSEQVQNVIDLESARDVLNNLIPTIEANVTNEEERQRLLNLARDRISAIENETNIRPLREARTQVEALEGDILALQGSRNALISERDSLIAERTSADANRLTDIDSRLAAIPGEISELESQLAVKQGELDTANIALANLEVANAIPVIMAHREYLENTLQNAIDAQGIVSAVNINVVIIIGISNQVQTIRETVERAEESENKRQLISLIQNIEGTLEQIKQNYRAEPASEDISAEELESRNFDLTTQAGHEAFMTLFADITPQNISAELQEFLGVTIQNPEDVRDIFTAEYLRQIQEEEARFESAPVNNVQNLKQILARREEMISRYTSSFEVAYENTDFQEIIARKQTEIKALNIQDIEGFSNLYTETINNLTATGEEKALLSRVLNEFNPSYTDLRVFYTQQVPTLAEISEELERTLTTSTFEIFEQYITI